MEVLGAVAEAEGSEVGFDFGGGEGGGWGHVVVGFGVEVADQGTVVRAEFLHLTYVSILFFSGTAQKGRGERVTVGEKKGGAPYHL